MRKIAFLTVVVIFTILITNYKQVVADHKIQEQKNFAISQQIEMTRLERLEAIKKEQAEQTRLATIKAQEDAQKQAQAVEKPPSIPASSAVSCREAIAQTWPTALQSGAITVLVNENRSEDPNAVGKVNSDGVGSQDFGCFQINNHWHKGFFATSDWRDPVANAAYAYKIYQGRGNWTAWYAVKGILW